MTLATFLSEALCVADKLAVRSLTSIRAWLVHPLADAPRSDISPTSAHRCRIWEPLDEIDRPVVAAAQAAPEQRDAGGAKRILALNDPVWFKVKLGDQ